MAGGTWERCVREVTLAADPETVGSVGVGWNNLSAGLGHLRDALVGRSFVGPIASGQERPHSGGLPGLLAGWTGSGGDAYREHLGGIGKDIEELITHASDVSGALSRIEGDIRTAVASIPIPLMDDFGWNEWSLPGGTELDDARDGESQSGFLASLRSDYQQNQSLYADGAFRDKADDLEATMRVDGNADDQKRGGWWDTKSHLDNWYRDNQEAANRAMSPLPAAVETERPKLVVPQPSANDARDGYTPDNRVPPSGVPDTGLPGGGGGGGGKAPSLGSAGIGGGGGGSYGGGSFSPPPTTGGVDLGGGQSGGGSYVPSVTGGGYPGSGDHDYGTGLAGAGGPGTITTGGPGSAFGGGGGGLGTAGGGGGFGGGGAGLGAGGGLGGGGLGAAGGPGVGALPGLVGGGNGRIPPLTSAASALRNATGAGGGGGMMGGGMMGGPGGAGHGGGGAEHSSWLTEDDDPWGAGDSASPGVLR